MASHIDEPPIAIPVGVEVKIEGQDFSAEGAKGSDSYVVPGGIITAVEGNEIVLTVADDPHPARAKHGLARSIMAGMVKDVHGDYSEILETVGTGYRAAARGQGIELFLGYSHTITVSPSEGITPKVTSANHVVVEGADRQAVGQVAANIRKLRASEPYKGRDIKYSDEHIPYKAGKAGK